MNVAINALPRQMQQSLVIRPTSDKTPSLNANPAKLSRHLAYGVTGSDLKAIGGDNEEMRRALSLHLASQPQLNQFNKHQAMALFARGPNDTGSPEVQAAILTVRIAYLAQHAAKHRLDYKATRLITEVIHARKRHLKYLKRISLPRFFELLSRLGLPPDYLESFEKGKYNFKYRE